MTIGESIHNYRTKMNLSQEELANKILVSRQTVSLWEKDQTQPTIDNLKRLKEVFGVPIDKVLCGSHGLDMPEDLNIVHLYKGYPKEEK